MSSLPTPRQVAREQTVARIKELALVQLAESGAGSLSLRAIARELDLVSSAIYRYFPNRDELVTALVVDAYDDLAAALEEAAGGSKSPVRRWVALCEALRGWASAEPSRFLLAFGAPLPGYAQPEETIEPAARVLRSFCEPAQGAKPSLAGPVPRTLTPQLNATIEALGLDLDRAAVLALTGAYARVVGLVTLELNGHLIGMFDPSDTLFTTLVEHEAAALGLPRSR